MPLTTRVARVLLLAAAARAKPAYSGSDAENCGVDGSIVAQKVIESDSDQYGFNALTREYENLVESGVIVPTKVERVALHNAASISGLLLTTDCAITELKEKKDKAPAMGGMDF